MLLVMMMLLLQRQLKMLVTTKTTITIQAEDWIEVSLSMMHIAVV